MSSENPQCAIIIMSCDSHDDIADVSAKMFHTFWPDCPFETILVNELSDKGGFSTILSPGKLPWSKRLTASLNATTAPYVVLMCDDYLISKTVNTPQFLKRLDDAKRLDVLNLRLAMSPATVRFLQPHAEDDLMEYPKNKPYCIATQPGIWNREGLLAIASQTASAWDFERVGTQLSQKDPRPVLATKYCEFHHIDAVRRGLWYPPALPFCEKAGVHIDLQRRARRPLSTSITWAIRDFIYGLAPQFFTNLSTWWTAGK